MATPPQVSVPGTRQEVSGRSRNLSFDEAFADAIKNLPPRTPSHPYEIDVVTVIEIKGEFGGFTGLHDLVVMVRRHSF